MIKEVFKEDIKEYLRNKKLLFVLIIIIFIISTVYASGFFQIAYLLFFKPQNILPFPISLTYYLLFISIPLFVVLLGHDSVSGDIENYTIRGIISKISRKSYITAKFLSLLTIISGISFVMIIGSVIFTFFRFGELEMAYPLLFFVYLVLYSAALSSMAVFFSSLVSRSISSLLIKIAFLFFLLYMNTVDIPYLSIFHYMNNVFEGIPIAIMVFSVYVILFLSSSIALFEVRDL